MTPPSLEELSSLAPLISVIIAALSFIVVLILNHRKIIQFFNAHRKIWSQIAYGAIMIAFGLFGIFPTGKVSEPTENLISLGAGAILVLFGLLRSVGLLDSFVNKIKERLDGAYVGLQGKDFEAQRTLEKMVADIDESERISENTRLLSKVSKISKDRLESHKMTEEEYKRLQTKIERAKKLSAEDFEEEFLDT